MRAKVTSQSSQVLADLIKMSPSEQQWVQVQFWGSLEKEEREELLRLIADEFENEESEKLPFADLARERLLEDPDLTAGEKVLLASLIVSELFEADEFHSRQLTEILRQSSNPVNNITAAINGLIGKSEVEVADPQRTSKNSHKRFRLTPEGITTARSIARSKVLRRQFGQHSD